MRVYFYFVLITLFITNNLKSQIPYSLDTEELDSYMDSIKQNVSVPSTDYKALKSCLNRNLNFTNEQYLASFIHLLDFHRNKLSSIELSDIFYYISESLYETRNANFALQYINIYPWIKHELLDAHKLFLKGIICGNEEDDSKKALDYYYQIIPIYEKYNHSNQIRLFSGIALYKGEHGFKEESNKFFKEGIEKSNFFPGHHFIALLKINYLFFLSENNSFASRNSLNKLETYLSDIEKSPLLIDKLSANTLRLEMSQLVSVSEEKGGQIIQKGSNIVEEMHLLEKNSYGELNAIAEFYRAIARFLNQSENEETYLLSLEYVNKGIDLFKDQVAGQNQLLDLLKIKIELLYKLGKVNEVYHSYVFMDSLSQEFHSKYKNDAIAELSVKFKIQEEKLKSDLLNEKANRAYWVIGVLGFAFFTSLLFSLAVYRNNRIKQELNKKLSDSNKENEVLIHKLNESNISLEHFAALAAHDIKAPIRTIGSFAKLLYKKYQNEFTEIDKKSFEFIIMDSRKLSLMIDGLLNFSKLTTNLPPKELVEMNKLVEIIFLRLKSSIQNKDIHLEVLTPLPSIHVHEPLVSQLFLNLISNSIKFSKENQENVVKIDWEEKSDQFIEFVISDSGIGIPETILPSVFKMFSKFYKNKNYSGNGIGLATCSKIMSHYNGQIDIQSTEGVGTTIRLKFQMKKMPNNVFDILNI